MSDPLFIPVKHPVGVVTLLDTGEILPYRRTDEGITFTLPSPICGKDTPAAVFQLLISD